MLLQTICLHPESCLGHPLFGAQIAARIQGPCRSSIMVTEDRRISGCQAEFPESSLFNAFSSFLSPHLRGLLFITHRRKACPHRWSEHFSESSAATADRNSHLRATSALLAVSVYDGDPNRDRDGRAVGGRRSTPVCGQQLPLPSARGLPARLPGLPRLPVPDGNSFSLPQEVLFRDGIPSPFLFKVSTTLSTGSPPSQRPEGFGPVVYR